MDGDPEFGRLRRMIWPIRRGELKKFLPMLLMFFFISFVYSLLRNTKDTLIVTAPGGGADLIPFLKVYGVIPVSVLFMLAYARMSNLLSRRALFYAALVPFAGLLFLLRLHLPGAGGGRAALALAGPAASGPGQPGRHGPPLGVLPVLRHGRAVGQRGPVAAVLDLRQRHREAGGVQALLRPVRARAPTSP